MVRSCESPDVMEEPRKWLVELQTSDEHELNRIWSDFDDWFESSEAHRKAYAQVKRSWLRLTGQPPDPRENCATKYGTGLKIRARDLPRDLQWRFLLLMAAAVLALTVGTANTRRESASSHAQGALHRAH